MGAPFQPADGVQARWRYCYDLALTRDPRDQITLQEVMELLDCTRQAAIQAMDEARAHLEADGKGSLITVENFGWIIPTAADMLRLTEKRDRKTFRQSRRTTRIIDAVPRTELTQFERQALDRLSANHVRLQELKSRRRIPLSQIGQPELPAASGE
jgi:hypothetical protein